MAQPLLGAQGGVKSTTNTASSFAGLIPLPILLLLLAAPPLRLLGYHPPVQGWSGLGSAMLISFLWPLTLTPLHWFNFRLLHWKNWGYAGLPLLGNLLITALVLMAREGL